MGRYIRSISLKLRSSTLTIYHVRYWMLDGRCSTISSASGRTSWRTQDCAHNKNYFFALSAHLTENSKSKLSRSIMTNHKRMKVFT